MNTTLDQIKSTLEDRILSRGEKKALKAVIKDQQFSKNDLNRLRSEIFKEALSYFKEHKDQQIINWLEEANKLLLPSISDSSYCKSYFSPGNDCLDAICNQISYAANSIDICVFTISDNQIRDKIIYALSKGVKVRIITDNDKTMDLGSDIDYLFQRGANIKIDNTSHHMHHKFAIFDQSLLLTGSYNWTRSAAQHNQENILETTDPKAIQSYQTEFDRLWNAMDEYKY